MYLGDDFLVSQMMDFVEELPAVWQPKWEDMRQKAGKPFKQSRSKFEAGL
jgi:hypothetical protein